MRNKLTTGSKKSIIKRKAKEASEGAIRAPSFPAFSSYDCDFCRCFCSLWAFLLSFVNASCKADDASSAFHHSTLEMLKLEVFHTCSYYVLKGIQCARTTFRASTGQYFLHRKMRHNFPQRPQRGTVLHGVMCCAGPRHPSKSLYR